MTARPSQRTSEKAACGPRTRGRITPTAKRPRPSRTSHRCKLSRVFLSRWLSGGALIKLATPVWNRIEVSARTGRGDTTDFFVVYRNLFRVRAICYLRTYANHQKSGMFALQGNCLGGDAPNALPEMQRRVLRAL